MILYHAFHNSSREFLGQNNIPLIIMLKIFKKYFVYSKHAHNIL